MILYPSENVRRLGEGEGEIVYTQREPRPTTSSEIFTMSEGESEVHVREQHIVYLITYSRADLEKIPTRQTFAETVCEAFAKTRHATVKTMTNAQYLMATLICARQNLPGLKTLSLERSVEQAVKQTIPAQNVREENVDCQYMMSHS